MFLITQSAHGSAPPAFDDGSVMRVDGASAAAEEVWDCDVMLMHKATILMI